MSVPLIGGTRGYIELDSSAEFVHQLTMSLVFLIHFSTTAVLPSITLFNHYQLAFTIAYVIWELGAKIGEPPIPKLHRLMIMIEK